MDADLAQFYKLFVLFDALPLSSPLPLAPFLSLFLSLFTSHSLFLPLLSLSRPRHFGAVRPLLPTSSFRCSLFRPFRPSHGRLAANYFTAFAAAAAATEREEEKETRNPALPPPTPLLLVLRSVALSRINFLRRRLYERQLSASREPFQMFSSSACSGRQTGQVTVAANSTLGVGLSQSQA